MKTISCFILCSLLVISACKKKEDDDMPSSNGNSGTVYLLTIDSGWQVKAKIDSVYYSRFDDNGLTGEFTNILSTHTDPDSVVYTYGSVLQNGSDIVFALYKGGQSYPDGQLMLNQDF